MAMLGESEPGNPPPTEEEIKAYFLEHIELVGIPFLKNLLEQATVAIDDGLEGVTWDSEGEDLPQYLMTITVDSTLVSMRDVGGQVRSLPVETVRVLIQAG